MDEDIARARGWYCRLSDNERGQEPCNERQGGGPDEARASFFRRYGFDGFYNALPDPT